jgi:hypothetical protein
MATIAETAKTTNVPIAMLIEKLSFQFPDKKWDKNTELPTNFNLANLPKPAPEAIEHLQMEGKLTKQQAVKILKAESLATSIVCAVREVEIAVAFSEGQVGALERIEAINQGEASILKAWQDGRLGDAKSQFQQLQSRMAALTGSAQQILSDKVQAGEMGKDLLSQIREFTI